MKIIGFDPGIARTGFGIIETDNHTFTAIDYGVIETPAHTDMAKRLLQLFHDINTIIRTHTPQKASIEKLFFAKNTTTAMAVAQARGVIILAIAQHSLPIHEYTPLQIKQALTSYGKADKAQMQKMVQLVFKLPHIPQPDDAADALAVALCAAQKNYA